MEQTSPVSRSLEHLTNLPGAHSQERVVRCFLVGAAVDIGEAGLGGAAGSASPLSLSYCSGRSGAAQSTFKSLSPLHSAATTAGAATGAWRTAATTARQRPADTDGGAGAAVSMMGRPLSSKAILGARLGISPFASDVSNQI